MLCRRGHRAGSYGRERGRTSIGSVTRQLRCAIYTRKSSEEGLEQDFNSLHAQREACEAYIVSQRHEGWRALPKAYDDGGYSGGGMERPALQLLLSDIGEGIIDTVVVYKVDRLTRSLNDFAKIVDIFDRHGVSFVSVTQAFNTTTSMGRLTLNVLLSFAQFEREVTGERIRDKIAASKKKGLWMGGFVPIGYEAKDRTLVINEAEAETIRTIYRLYLDLKSVDALKVGLDRMGLRTKLRPCRSKRIVGGLAFSRGHLYRILSSPLYIGQISHRKSVYPGQHPAIIDRETWDAVQTTLRLNSHARLVKAHSKNPSLLAGLIFDENDVKLVATHANKHGRRYRYYVSPSTLRRGRKRERSEGQKLEAVGTPTSWRLPAAEIEGLVTRMLVERLRDRAWLLDQFADDVTLENRQSVLARAANLAAQLEGDDNVAKRGLALSMIERVAIERDVVALELRPEAVIGSEPSSGTQSGGERIPIRQATSLRRRGRETKLVFEGAQTAPEPDPALIKAVAQAHRWWRDLVEGRFATLRDLARAYGTHERYAARVLNLAFLSTDDARAILEGTQAAELTLHRFLRGGVGSLDS